MIVKIMHRFVVMDAWHRTGQGRVMAVKLDADKRG